MEDFSADETQALRITLPLRFFHTEQKRTQIEDVIVVRVLNNINALITLCISG